MESDTKKYDAVAIKFMSVVLLPCLLGYAGYSLRYKKYKSWYSFVISTLAGTVYTFGRDQKPPQRRSERPSPSFPASSYCCDGPP